ncbi:hypothetical protein [Salipiger aestuarii]|uniref:hypothetical protein n=1 Tax=Salipiger aestuarii TaxID=568098 RepID=UPI00123A1BC7|nr:hypothetical protein [Salipiger aestuarii]
MRLTRAMVDLGRGNMGALGPLRGDRQSARMGIFGPVTPRRWSRAHPKPEPVAVSATGTRALIETARRTAAGATTRRRRRDDFGRNGTEWMALVQDLSLRQLQHFARHKPVRATFSSGEVDGEKLLQIDTYGTASRKFPDKVSQSLQLDKSSAKLLKMLIEKEFDL